jgi:hypothetical protein
MTKQEEFLWIVQTAILSNAINLASDAETRVTYRDTYSSTGVRIVMREAIRASGLIPANLDGSDAADQFCLWMFRNHKDSMQKGGSKHGVPGWFARS